jgi:hypothetical protein
MRRRAKERGLGPNFSNDKGLIGFLPSLQQSHFASCHSKNGGRESDGR